VSAGVLETTSTDTRDNCGKGMGELMAHFLICYILLLTLLPHAGRSMVGDAALLGRGGDLRSKSMKGF
jgi:hypothetical protein